MFRQRLSKFVALAALLLLGPVGVHADPGPPSDDGNGAWSSFVVPGTITGAAPPAGSTWVLAIFYHEDYCDGPVNWLNQMIVGDGVALSENATERTCLDETDTPIPDTGHEVWGRVQTWCSATGTPCDDPDPDAEAVEASLQVFGLGLVMLTLIWGAKQVFRVLTYGRHE